MVGEGPLAVVRERKAPGRQFYGQTRNLRPRLSRCDCVNAKRQRQWQRQWKWQKMPNYLPF